MERVDRACEPYAGARRLRSDLHAGLGVEEQLVVNCYEVRSTNLFTRIEIAEWRRRVLDERTLTACEARERAASRAACRSVSHRRIRRLAS